MSVHDLERTTADAGFSNPVIRWIDYRLPLFTFLRHELDQYSAPRNLNYLWNFGSLAGIILLVMIATGIVLAMHYVPTGDGAFRWVEHIMRDVNYGWLIRYTHATGASMFFAVVYIHIFRGLYYGSYKAPRELLWWIGVIILLLMMATAFFGYTLPWGQMSFWGATVITNLFSAVPIVGDSVVTWLWGGFTVGDPTLNRFYALHYLLPFVIVAVVGLQPCRVASVWLKQPDGVETKNPGDTIPFHPYYTVKDLLGLIGPFSGLWVVRFLRAKRSSQLRQLYSRKSRSYTCAHRARMVPAAVLCDPALHPEQAARCCRDAGRHSGVVPAAVARHQPGALRAFPARLPSVLLAPGR